MDDTNDKPTVAPLTSTIEDGGVLRSQIDLHVYITRLQSTMEPLPDALVMSFPTFNSFYVASPFHVAKLDGCLLMGIPVQLGEYEDGYIGAIHEVSPAPTKKSESHEESHE